MLLETIAAVILGGMMLVPIINMVAGAFIGAAIAGPPGAAAGFLLAILITVAQKWMIDRFGWGEVRCILSEPEGPALVTSPPTGRRRFARGPAGRHAARTGARRQAVRA